MDSRRAEKKWASWASSNSGPSAPADRAPASPSLQTEAFDLASWLVLLDLWMGRGVMAADRLASDELSGRGFGWIRIFCPALKCNVKFFLCHGSMV